MTWLRDRRHIALLGGTLCLAAAGASCFAMFIRKWRDDTSNSGCPTSNINPPERPDVNHFKHWGSNITHFPKTFKPFRCRSPSAEGIDPVSNCPIFATSIPQICKTELPTRAACTHILRYTSNAEVSRQKPRRKWKTVMKQTQAASTLMLTIFKLA